MARRPIINGWIWWWLADMGAVVASYYASIALLFNPILDYKVFMRFKRLLYIGPNQSIATSGMEALYLRNAPIMIGAMAIVITLFYGLMQLYETRRFIRPRPVAWHIIVINVSLFFLGASYFFIRRKPLPRSFMVMVVALNIVFGILLRYFVDSIVRFGRMHFSQGRLRTFLLGKNEFSERLRASLSCINPRGIEVIENKEITVDPDTNIDPVLEELRSDIKKRQIDLIICSLPDLTVVQLMSVLSFSVSEGVACKLLSSKLDVLWGEAGIKTDMIRNIPLVHFDPPGVSAKDWWFRRAISRTLAVIAVLAISPLFLIVAIMIKIDSKGPVFFIQERVGVDRKPFKMYKFRTMRTDAEQMRAEVERYNESDAGLFKIRNDPRVTRVGRLLRRLSIDEFPQLFNVLKGDMRIVGPRPLPKCDFEQYFEEWHYGRHNGMPGLTCLWQISGRSDIGFENMCILDMYYLRNQNWALDLRIILKTIWVVLFAKGAY